ncbi:MAG: hypothetical protein COX81_01405 [Candidatus Magasanikbacteria bacterium CG_4_10_14_0_2_um_filter_37_12]|uniref:DUF8128 domain-containing protein n=1 Tax=Candidatus Magasanikbacteria bacterium CG_4_10_14_0_2_um_filter_37_12 TaxID=1974637 RepID=A0A2M7V8V9_9BACT|nr:MAG: hypothetical protein COX81_01405 [Candidatus Magasanikbacteria bacterium CG_4_10_14_0_2_um_filter_37_12]
MLEIILDFFAKYSSAEIVIIVFIFGGWLFLFYLLFFASLHLLAEYKSDKWKKDWKYVLLAIDIPPLNVQTPKAVEQFFSHIYSVLETPSIGTKYRRGFEPYKFSLEIISIEGYIQFLIRTLDKYQDVVEAAIYAQYPDSDITEVEDYTESAPEKFPNEEYDMWGADFNLTEHYAFPIRMYSEFEHNISKDTVLKDPIGTFLESFSRIGSGEQMWYQIIIEPAEGAAWKKECIKKIKELIGEDVKHKPGMFSWVFDNPITKEIGKSFEEMGAQMTGGIRAEDTGSKSSDDGSPNQLQYLTPGQKKLVEAMEDKIGKIGFKTKIRAIYLATKVSFKPSNGVNSLIGAINQFNIPTSNSLAPNYVTSAEYFNATERAEHRKRQLMKAFRKRKTSTGKKADVLNIEELATIWHFPMSHVATPNVQSATLKTSEPPSGLPMEFVNLPVEEIVENESAKKKRYQTDSGDTAYGDDMNFG